jgi:7-carboxy-7-deazaguanine synthase
VPDGGELIPRKVPLIEMFGPTMQGEGALAGQISHFIRFGGCSYRCIWCDSLHAVLPEKMKGNTTWLQQEELVDMTTQDLGKAPWVTLSGGDPLLWNLGLLVRGLQNEGYKVSVETQGAFWKDWLRLCDQVTVSPKPPSSGMAEKFDLERLKYYHHSLGDKMSLKFVVFNEYDLEWAWTIVGSFPGVSLYLSAGTDQENPYPQGSTIGNMFIQSTVLSRYSWLVQEVLKMPKLYHATILPQLHVLVWGNKQGV